jgi:hypothetical protein
MKDPKDHLRIIGSIYIVLGWITGIGTIILLFVAFNDLLKILRGGATDNIWQLIILISAGILLLLSLSSLYIYFGKALKVQKKWATNYVGYILGMTISFSFPIGTAIGFYTIWGLVQFEKQKTT